MTKRVSSFPVEQLGFTFDPPTPASAPADLAGLDRFVAASVAAMLKGDKRSRQEIAGAMSALLDDETTKLMLDAYASEARDNHNISAPRLLALIAVTSRFDIADALMRRIGAAVLVGEELMTARLGSLKAERLRLNEEIKDLQRRCQPIARGKR
ncbi:hypothetical protein [Sphingomonas paucimobilis]|uniref:Uncharacterized protein n=1 Tax=Sphingomonas paucimobilis TaxID=13689 RepID=A0A7T3A9F6_SPHPI|nr:hypothetical protein [Sphingomonas paucimobilis]QPT08611.1 hypothetical protein I6G38_18140 [Sphingomonas paucimobilis]